MKRVFTYTPILLLFLFCFSGCSAIGSKTASLSIIYAATTTLALLLLFCYLLLIRDKSVWFILLFSSVLLVNIGYLWLSLSPSLEHALMANRAAYLGSVPLPMAMLMIIIEVSGGSYRKRLPCLLTALAVIVFLIAASPGILDIYYREVSFESVNGVSVLRKVYGPLHPLYLFYLLGYFIAMVVVIIRSAANKRMENTAHAAVLGIAVFVNIGVWLIGQLTDIKFEMLSVSYIISELFLLGVHLVVNEHKRLNALASDLQASRSIAPSPAVPSLSAVTVDIGEDLAERIEAFTAGLGKLTQTERAVYEAYIARATTKELMASLNIRENTLKFHNKNLYSKLGVSSRKELMEIYKLLQASGNATTSNSIE